MVGPSCTVSNTIPVNIFDLQHDDFYDFVEAHCGSVQANILKFQLISDAGTFIECENPTEILQYDSDRLKHLKENSCLLTSDGLCIVLYCPVS